MSATTAFSTGPSYEPRPRDFTVQYRRTRPKVMGRIGRKRNRGRGALLLLGAVTLPAFAAPGDWERFEIGDATEAEIAMQPMPFEQAGSSFPGSAFYYLQLDEEAAPRQFGEGIRSDADIAGPATAPANRPTALAMRIDNSGVDRGRAIQCLTAAIYFEARSEPDSGQRSVAQVVLNRVAHRSYPNTVCGVVYQGSERKTGCQFSFTCDGSLARKPSRMFWQRAENVARASLAGYVHAPAGLATHYHTVQINPYWAPKLDYLGTIGAHRFYGFHGAAGKHSSFRFAYSGGEPAARRHNPAKSSSTLPAAPDPVRLQAAFAARSQEPGNPDQTMGNGTRPASAPDYTQKLRERGGDAQFSGEKLPEAHGIRPEYRNSGRWIAKPSS